MTDAAAESPLRRFLLDVRSIFLWIIGLLHFAPVATFLVLLGAFIDPRRNDRPLRLMSRNVIRLTGTPFEVRRSPGFDPERAAFFVSNHVNVFAAYVIYSAIPQFVRGLELESHFRVPVYGWMAKRFGNIGVPEARTPAAMRAMTDGCRKALNDDISIIMFPEGHRTRTGRVGRFHLGVFRMAKEFGVPIVPMSIVGSFDLKRPQSWRLRPARIVVHLHDTIVPEEIAVADERELMERVHRIVSGPVDGTGGAPGGPE